MIEAGERPMLCVGPSVSSSRRAAVTFRSRTGTGAPSPARNRCPGRPGANTTSWAPTTGGLHRHRDRATGAHRRRRDLPVRQPLSGARRRLGRPRSEPQHAGYVGPAQAYAKRQPDYVISWVDHLDEERQEFSPVVYVAAFTGDRERHEAQIRECGTARCASSSATSRPRGAEWHPAEVEGLSPTSASSSWARARGVRADDLHRGPRSTSKGAPRPWSTRSTGPESSAFSGLRPVE